MLLLSFGAVIVCLTAVSLRIVDARLRRQMDDASRQQFHRSMQSFADAETERLLELERENKLLADLPSLKALMTTADDRTIKDGGQRFLQIGGSDLFALATGSGHVAAAYTREGEGGPALRSEVEKAIGGEGKRYLLAGGRLFGYSVQPLFFGEAGGGTLLGYVVTGYAVNGSVLQRLTQASGLEAIFRSGDQVVASTLPLPIAASPVLRAPMPNAMASVMVGSEHFEVVTHDLTALATAPLQIQLLRSLRETEANAHELDRLLALTGLFTGVVGAGLMLLVSAATTHSLRALARDVEAVGRDDGRLRRFPEHGPREVRQLSLAMRSMQERMAEARRALLEAERLATIGRMARSVSHDLRHYLSAVYANAEFLASADLGRAERSMFFEEIRSAVLGITDMIESLLLFSRTGASGPRKRHDLEGLLGHSVERIEHHPEAQGVPLELRILTPAAPVLCESRQIERALCNLLLNAAQAARGSVQTPRVEVALAQEGDLAVVRVSDNGEGVPPSVRDRLFEPFVSEGKQSGTGLGLTLAQQVARDHGGDLVLEHSAPGHTCFRFSMRTEGACAPRPSTATTP